MTKLKLYFAHPMAHYDTSFEKECLKAIKKRYGREYEIINPNCDFHQKCCEHFGFEHFVNFVKNCDAVVAVPYLDGKWGTGVWQEVLTAASSKKVYVGLKFQDTLEFFNFNIYKVAPLSISETRERNQRKEL